MTATHEALVAARTEKGIPVGMNKAQAGAVTRDVLERQLPALMSELSQMCADDYNRKVIIVSGSNEVSKSAFDPSVDSSSAERDLHDLSVELGEFGFRAIHRFDPVKYGPVWDQPSFQRSRAVAETFKNYRGDTNIEATEIDFLYQGETAFGDPGNYLLGDDKHFDYGKIGLALAEQESAAIARL